MEYCINEWKKILWRTTKVFMFFLSYGQEIKLSDQGDNS
jgi:hypothetical protein